MRSRASRLAIAIVVPAVALPLAQWYDGGVLVDIQRRAGVDYDPAPLFYGLSVTHLLTAFGAIAIGLAAWQSRSLLVGIAYAVVGGFIALLPALFWSIAIGVNGAPAVAPEPIARFITDLWLNNVGNGVTGSVVTLGAVMLISGVPVAVLAARDIRRSRPPTVPPAERIAG
jgi:hypothetical protein